MKVQQLAATRLRCKAEIAKVGCRSFLPPAGDKKMFGVAGGEGTRRDTVAPTCVAAVMLLGRLP